MMFSAAGMSLCLACVTGLVSSDNPAALKAAVFLLSILTYPVCPDEQLLTELLDICTTLSIPLALSAFRSCMLVRLHQCSSELLYVGFQPPFHGCSTFW